ncbi:MAG: hypothetical protein A2150_00520 [Candidatus Muproteobacteria bacterium RBG_16_64_11]|uniref:Tyr recombinase domain-containing protein n=1 Tax=Candidatus Muproteobacteria bacterium RBG_16_64_11 TaxID=1817758 RepID=A0A1F6T9N0_9PROT|nr:MAG: hypothetical protein A2150_00520 [Candidatus Muproteobacteria bacterium RBG_16_64_11]
MTKLTKTAIDGYTYKGNGGQDIRWDGQMTGFGCRVYPSGRKAYVLAYRAEGRKHIMVLGPCNVLTLDQGRRLAQTRLAEVIDGIDPMAERRKALRGETVADLCRAYIERHAIPHKKTADKDQRRLDRFILSAWRNHKIKAITRADVAALHHEIGRDSGPYEANRVLALLSKMFELAMAWGYLDETAANPAHRIKKFKEEKRDRWVTPEELPRLAEAIDREVDIYARAALWLYLLTGLRKSELLNARWDDVDLDRKELRLADTKAGRVHYVPLSEPALALLRDLPRLADNHHVIPGREAGKGRYDIKKPWDRVRTAAGVSDVRLHDLRRTVGSWMAQAGNSLHLIGRVLNQSNPSTTAIYARFGQDHVRDALEAHGKKIMGVAKGKRADVVKIAGGRLMAKARHRATRKAALILYDETPPPADRLRAMIDACASNDLSTSMRSEIVNALKSIEANRLNEELRRQGRPVALDTFRAAALARELVGKHGVKPEKSAITAAVETVRTLFPGIEITGPAVARRYSKLKLSPDCSMMTPKRDKIVLALITDGVVDHALARLPASARGTRTNRIPKPPFVIAVARLSKPVKNGNK